VVSEDALKAIKGKGGGAMVFPLLPRFAGSRGKRKEGDNDMQAGVGRLIEGGGRGGW